MTHEIQQTEDGRFAVFELSPVEIARFASETHARMFVERILEADARGAITGTAEAAPEREKTPEERAGLPPLGGFTGELMRQADHGAGAFEDDPWEAALARVAAGEGCKTVAEAMGLPFTGLRARLAARRKQALLKDSVEADETVTAENGQDAPSAPAAPPVPEVARVNLTVTADKRVARVLGALSLPEEVEDVRGRPDLVARHKPVWTEEIDMAVIEAGDDEEAIWRIAAETGASIERVKCRQTTLMEQVAREMRQ